MRFLFYGNAPGFSACIGLFLALAALPVQAQYLPPNSFAEHIVWQRAPTSWADFISQSSMAGDGQKPMVLHPQQRVLLDEHIRAATRMAGTSALESRPCAISTYTTTSQKPGPHALHLVDLLYTQQLVTHGTVVDVQAGWGIGGAKTMVYVRSEEILVCQPSKQTRLVLEGDVVSISIAKANFEVAGAVFCNRTDEMLRIPAIGDRVLVSGYPGKNDAHYIGRGLIFPVIENRVIPQPFEVLAERVEYDLDWVRGFFVRSPLSCGGAP